MRDYAKVSPQFWTRGSGKRLRGDAEAQVLALYLVTCPSANMVGVYYVPFVAIAHETGLGVEHTRAALDRLATAGFAFYDEDAELAWVPNMASYQIGDELKEGDKRRGGPIRAEVEKIGSHRFVVEFWNRYGDGYGLGPCPYQVANDPLSQAPSKPLRSPSDAPCMGDTAQSGRAGEEQEKNRNRRGAGEESQATLVGGEDHREETKPQTLTLLPDESSNKPAGPFEDLHAHFLAVRKAHNPKTRAVKPVPADRQRVRALLARSYTLDDLKLSVEGLFLSEHHVDNGYTDLEYALRDGNLSKFIGLGEAQRAREERRSGTQRRASTPSPAVDASADTPSTPEVEAEREALLRELAAPIDDPFAVSFAEQETGS